MKMIKVWEVVDAMGRVVKVYHTSKAAYTWAKKYNISLAGWRVRENSYSCCMKRQKQIETALKVLDHAITHLDCFPPSVSTTYIDGQDRSLAIARSTSIADQDAIRILNHLYCELHAERRAIERESEPDEMEY